MDTNNAYLEAVDSLIDQLEVRKEENSEPFNLTNTEQLLKTVAERMVAAGAGRDRFLRFARLFRPDYEDSEARTLFANLPQGESRTAQESLKAVDDIGIICKTLFAGIVKGEKRLPVDGIPENFRRYVLESAAAFRCHPDFVVASLFSAVATVAARKRSVVYGEFTNYLQLQIAIVAPSGTGKSPQLTNMFQPIAELDETRNRDYRSALAEWRRNGEKGSRPVPFCYLVDDTTPEALNEMLAQNFALTNLTDELRAYFDDKGRYNKSDGIGRALSMFNNTTIRVARKTDDAVSVSAPVLSICGTIQPSALAATFGQRNLTGSGFCDRWLFVWPDEVVYQKIDPDAPEKTISAKASAYWRGFVEYMDKAKKEAPISFSDAARRSYIDYFNELQDKNTKANARGDDWLCAIYSKLQVHVIRWALAIQVMRDYDAHLRNDIPAAGLEVESMDFAIRCMSYFERTAIRVGQTKSSPGQISSAQAIRALASVYPELCRADLARAIGKDPSYITKILNHK